LHPSTLAKRVFFLLLLAVFAFYFYGLGFLPLVGPDEPRYAQVAREMFLRGDLVTPTLGGHTWFEKPALLYWMMIAAFKLFGVHEWSARVGPAICGLLTIAAVWFVGRQVERTTLLSESVDLGFWSALVCASSLGLIVFSRGASFDIVITMTSAWALGFFISAEISGERRKRLGFLAGFYCFVGLSMMAKGLVGLVIPFGVVGLYYLIRRAWPNHIVWLSLLWGLPLAILVASIWYGPVIYKHGWLFIDEFFIQHHFARYVSNKYHHPQPLYFYPAILLMLLVPWSPVLIDALIRAKNWRWRDGDSQDRVLVFALAWVAMPIVFFSFSGSKLPGYILPVIPAASILIGSRLGQSKLSLKLTAALCVFMGVVGLVYLARGEKLPIAWSVAAAMPFVIGGVLTFFLKRSSAILTIGTSVFATIVVVLNCVAPVISQRESTRQLLMEADALGYSKLPVLALRSDDRSAEFYAHDRVVYQVNGQLTTLDEVPLMIAEARERGERILAFIPSEEIERFSDVAGIEVIGDNGKQVLLCIY